MNKLEGKKPQIYCVRLWRLTVSGETAAVPVSLPHVGQTVEGDVIQRSTAASADMKHTTHDAHEEQIIKVLTVFI